MQVTRYMIKPNHTEKLIPHCADLLLGEETALYRGREHSIHSRTLSSWFLLCSGTFVSLHADLSQKLSVPCMLLCPNSP